MHIIIFKEDGGKSEAEWTIGAEMRKDSFWYL